MGPWTEAGNEPGRELKNARTSPEVLFGGFEIWRGTSDVTGGVGRELVDPAMSRMASGHPIAARPSYSWSSGAVGQCVTNLPLVVQVVGKSGSGKTRVIEQVLRALDRRRLRVAVVKHSHHAPDLEGKDTARFSRAGAHVVLFASDLSFALFRGDVGPLVRALPVDLVLVEGYSRRRWGAHRFRVQSPRNVPSTVARILEIAPVRPRRSILVVDGRSRPADPLWRWVLNLLELRGAREVRREP